MLSIHPLSGGKPSDVSSYVANSRLIEAHNAAVARALEYIQTFGAAPGRGRA